MSSTPISIQEKQVCFHCGNNIGHPGLYIADEHSFCCLGCQSVYQLLTQNQLNNYYRYQASPGQQKKEKQANYAYLEEEKIANQLIDYQDERICIITFYIPQIHCSSCIWLLEHLYRLNPHISNTRVDFLKKQARITFLHQEYSLKELAELLDEIGYPPIITLQDVVKDNQKKGNNILIKKIAVAGFCFGNAMMASFPEYFGMASFEKAYAQLFGWINLSFAIPSMVYSGNEYFISAIKSIQKRQLNLDVPLALGIFILFIRSAYEVIFGIGPGFSDTLCGLVFFLLVGKWVQQKTYHHLSFERDYRSYFPVAVSVLVQGKEQAIPLSDLQVGDRILVRNQEIIPADAILLRGQAQVDFSFVTGESNPIEKSLGEILYAGGKLISEAVELEIVKPVSQSYLTSLWNQVVAEKESPFQSFSNTISQYFTPILLSIALSSALFWLIQGSPDKAWGAFTAVLIIACPCALALSSPFTLSAILNFFDKQGFFLKNTLAVEKMAALDTLVFDKTGTITASQDSQVLFKGRLTEEEEKLVYLTCRNSQHPQSRAIMRQYASRVIPERPVDFQEIPGKGIHAYIGHHEIWIGSASFVGLKQEEEMHSNGTYVKIGNEIKGVYQTERRWRGRLKTVFTQLASRWELHLISGDGQQDRNALTTFFPYPEHMHFNQLPRDKWHYIQALQKQGKKVAMLGDGLNDGAALKQADLGIAVSDDVNNFSPACDGILRGDAFSKLPRFLKVSKQAMRIIYGSFSISLCYNLFGLYIAVQGTLSPLFAAILMPLSTVTIVSFTSLSARYLAFKNNTL